MFNLTPAVRILLFANLIVFFAGYVFESSGIDLNAEFGLYTIQSTFFKPYQFLTYMFLHGDFFHIFSNMFGLIVFGSLLEKALGSNRFYILYFVCGLGAGVLNSGVNYWEANKMEAVANRYLMNPSSDGFIKFIKEEAPEYKNPSMIELMKKYEDAPSDPEFHQVGKSIVTQLVEKKKNIPMVGASGAVFGIIMAFGLLFPNLQMMLLFPPIPVKAKYLVLFYTGFELYALAQNNPGDNIAHFAHIGGMIFAYFLIRYWRIPRHY